ncbi:MAG: HAD-IIIA family hydrolase, partial [Bryobacterales bacterium]
QRLHARIEQVLPLDEIRMCPHDDADRCACRKPQPGMLLEAAAERHIDLTRSFMVGDRWKDIEAGRQAGCRTVWLENLYAETKPKYPDLTVGSLAEAVHWMVELSGQPGGNPA